MKQRFASKVEQTSKVSQVIRDNAMSLLPIVSNLFISNLHEEMTEAMLTKVFNKFGEV